MYFATNIDSVYYLQTILDNQAIVFFHMRDHWINHVQYEYVLGRSHSDMDRG